MMKGRSLGSLVEYLEGNVLYVVVSGHLRKKFDCFGLYESIIHESLRA